jgi:hypothetical protein
VGPEGPQGNPGTPALDRGSIAGVVKDSIGTVLGNAFITTTPATTKVATNSVGAFVLSNVPMGAYNISASKTGYVDASLTAIGVVAGGTTRVSLSLAPVAPTTGTLTGTVFGRKTGSGASGPVAESVPLSGAQVCIQATHTCVTTAADGTYLFKDLAPGFVFVSASESSYLAGETRSASFVSAGATSAGVNVTLSGRPPVTATYLGSDACISCHQTLQAGLIAAWKGSAHYGYTDRTLAHLDTAGWPAAPTTCDGPAIVNTQVGALDPAVATGDPTRNVFLVRWGAACGAGKPAFAMAFDTNNSGVFDTGDTLMPITGTFGGVATEAGQCGNGGILPATASCAATFGSATTAAVGWWQQEYLMPIGGGNKPAWVTWDVSGTPNEALTLPLTYNQRVGSGGWINAPDYNPTQVGTFSQACGSCHESGLKITTDANGNVNEYSSAEPVIGCEKCHGPGSAHASSADVRAIINPAFLTAQAEREVCGQCHTNGVNSVSPATLGYAWNDQATVGGGNFIPGVHQLSDFLAIPSYGDPNFYWPSGYANIDHAQYMDLSGSVHANNSYEKITCTDCHNSHGGQGGPYQIQRTDSASADVYSFQNNAAAMRNDVLCLACHATHGSFSTVSLADVARYHVYSGGSVTKNGAKWDVPAADGVASQSLIANTVNSHMMVQAEMPAYFDPTGSVAAPVGRCTSCHMAKTSVTAAFYPGLDANGKTANLIGDVSSHTFQVAMPNDSLQTWAGAATWDAVMPNACGSCHAGYRFGK